MTGSGTALDPYVIWDVNDLQDIALDLAAYYELGQNIDASATRTWNPTVTRGPWAAHTLYLVNDWVTAGLPSSNYLCHTEHTSGATWGAHSDKWDDYFIAVNIPAYRGFLPIGRGWASKFTGTFNSRGYAMTGLFMNRPAEHFGLFDVIDGGIVRNLKLLEVDLAGTEGASIANIAWASALSNCESSGIIRIAAYSAGGFVRLIGAGAGQEARVERCETSCQVVINDAAWTGAYVYPRFPLGGFVAEMEEAAGGTVAITQCKATGDVDPSCSEDVGGFVGHMVGGTIREGIAIGDVVQTELDTSNIGGFVGRKDAGLIVDSYARGRVAVINGGFLGGFAGENDGGIQNSYSTGEVHADNPGWQPPGGFCGVNYGTIVNCFWDTEKSGIATSDGGTGKTTEQMKSWATFLDAGWDMLTHKVHDPTGGYPWLSWQVPGASPIWYIYYVAPGPPPIPSVVTLPATEVR